MLSRGTPKEKSGAIKSLIGPLADCRGVLRSDDSVQIEGYFEGELFVKNTVYITENSQVKATIQAYKVFVSGEVIGNITAIHSITVTKTGRVYGNLSGNELHIEPGALYKGKVNMDVISGHNTYEGKFTLAKQ